MTERRRLRSSAENPKSKLFDFSRVNSLLYRDAKIRVDRRSKPTHENIYRFFEGPKVGQLPPKKSSVRRIESHVPRRNPSRGDPLGDDVYLPFHRRMKKDEKSMSLADKSRILNDVDNLKTQLSALRQNDWLKHLPATTTLHGCSSMEEFSVQRKLTIKELERIMQKFAEWERRNARLTAQMKSFEQTEESSDEDEDERILMKPLDKLVRQRKASWMKKHGPQVRITLRNGFDIVADPFMIPKVAIRPSLSS